MSDVGQSTVPPHCAFDRSGIARMLSAKSAAKHVHQFLLHPTFMIVASEESDPADGLHACAQAPTAIATKFPENESIARDATISILSQGTVAKRLFPKELSRPGGGALGGMLSFF